MEENNKTKSKDSSAQPEDKFKDKLSTKSAMLHTYKQDMEGLVRNRKVSLVSAMAAQSDKIDKDGVVAVNTYSDTKNRRSVTKLMLIVSVLMLILGGIIIFVAYSVYQTNQQFLEQDKASASSDRSLIFVEHIARFDATDRLPREIRTELAKMLVGSRASLGSITQIILEWEQWSDSLRANTKFSITQAQLIQLLGLNLSDQFIRLLGEPNDYMIGIHISDRNVPFILLTIESYEHAFASMLEWEKSAEIQLSPLFSTSGSPSNRRIFKDLVIQNIDVRASRDEDGNLKFLYAFLDRNTLLITNNVHTLTEINRRHQVRKAAGSAADNQ